MSSTRRAVSSGLKQLCTRCKTRLASYLLIGFPSTLGGAEMTGTSWSLSGSQDSHLCKISSSKLSAILGLLLACWISAPAGAQTVHRGSTKGSKKKPGLTVLIEGFSGAAGPYGATNGCDAPLASGGKCTIEVTFTPTVSGPQNGTLMIIDNAEHEPQSVKLEGRGK
jgi:hypothetical protein